MPLVPVYLKVSILVLKVECRRWMAGGGERNAYEQNNITKLKRNTLRLARRHIVVTFVVVAGLLRNL